MLILCCSAVVISTVRLARAVTFFLVYLSKRSVSVTNVRREGPREQVRGDEKTQCQSSKPTSSFLRSRQSTVSTIDCRDRPC